MGTFSSLNRPVAVSLHSLASFVLLLMVSLFATGCGTGKAEGDSDTDNQETSTNDGNDSTESTKKNSSNKSSTQETDSSPLEIEIVDVTDEIKKIRESKPARSLEGRWHLRVRQELQEVATSLFEVKKDKKSGLTIKPIELPLQGWKFQSGKVTDKSVEITIMTEEDGEVTFKGNLYNDVILGVFQFSTGESLPSRMTSTKDKSMDGKAVGLDFEHVDEFSNAYDEPIAKTSIARLFQFAKKYPLNPLTLQAYLFILRQSKSPTADLSDEDILTLVKNFKTTAQLWGKRRMLESYYGALGAILDKEYKPETLLKIVESARKDLGDLLVTSKEVAIFDYAEGRALLSMDAAEDVEKGIQLLRANPDEGFLKLFCNYELARFAKDKNDIELLESLLKENPLDPSYMYVLGQIADEKMDFQKALNYYSTIAALPGLEGILREIWTTEGQRLPSAQILAKDAWVRIHKSEKGLLEFLDQAYVNNIYAFTKKEVQVPPSAENQKTTLVELLTGSSCPPCVAADVALGGIEKSIPDSNRLIALRYHFHNPAPDPLTVREGQMRYSFYESKASADGSFGTPTIFVNGKRTTQMGGSLLNVSTNFQMLLDEVRPELKATTPVSLKADASIKENNLSLSVSAEGFPEDSENIKLRVVLAQKSVSYKSRNGVRIHDMLVRDMPGGAAGISPKDGKLEFSTKIAYEDMIFGLRDYLSKVEQGMGIIFPVRPVNIKELQLVAFVQNDETLEVLQTISVPVKGEFVAPPKKETSSDSENDSTKNQSNAPDETMKKTEGPSLVPTEVKKPKEESPAQEDETSKPAENAESTKSAEKPTADNE